MDVSTVSTGQPEGVPTCLYRHFDADGKLLYIGISLNGLARLHQHQKSSAWFYRIARVDMAWFPSRGEAEAAERAAIVAERPAHNITHAQGIPPALWDMIKGHWLADKITPEGFIPRKYASLTPAEVEELADKL